MISTRSKTSPPELRPPPECGLLEVAHQFLTLRSQEKWTETAALCHKDFFFVDLDKHAAPADGEDFKESDDIEAFISRGRFCTHGFPRVLRNLFSIRAFPATEVKQGRRKRILTWQFIL